MLKNEGKIWESEREREREREVKQKNDRLYRLTDWKN